MLGAVAGDIIGSPYRRVKADADFPLISDASRNTEITSMTLAVAEALMKFMKTPGEISLEESQFERELIFWMQHFARKFIKKIRYGKKFWGWLSARHPHPYESISNGAALRVSPVAWAFNNLEDVEHYAELTARVTHLSDESIKFARVMAGMVFLARMKKDKDDIKNYFQEKTDITLSKNLDELRESFYFVTTCPESISAALISFLESKKFEEAVRNAISLGGEANATASMAGAMAEAMSGLKVLTEAEAFEKLEKRLQFSVEKWEQWKIN